MFARLQQNADVERTSEALTQSAESSAVGTGQPAGRLHLDPHNRAVSTFDDEVDLLALVGPPMSRHETLVGPTELLQNFVDAECLEEVAKLRRRRRFGTSKFRLRQPEQMAGRARVGDMKLRAPYDPSAQCSTPGWQTVDQENGFEARFPKFEYWVFRNLSNFSSDIRGL